MKEQTVQLYSVVKHAVEQYGLEVDWALQLGGWIWMLATLTSALCTPSSPRLMFMVALTMVWASWNMALFPASGPLTWLVHFLLASSDPTRD